MSRTTPLSLSPDVDQTKSVIDNTVNSVGYVTTYASSVAAVEVQKGNLPDDLYQTISDSLQQVQSHAMHWLNQLGPKVTDTFPNMVQSYSDTFDSHADHLIQTLDTIMNDQNGTATESQKNDILDCIDALIQTIQAQSKIQQDIKRQLVDFNDTLERDHSSLSLSSREIQQALRDNNADQQQLHGEIQNVQNKIHDDQKKLKYLWLLGPIPEAILLNDIRNLRNHLEDLVRNLSGEQRESAELYMVGDTFDDLLSNNVHTQSIYSSVLDEWSVLHDKYTGVLDALQKASDDEIGGILQELDIQTAKTDWDQLAQFVAGLKQQSEQERKRQGIG